MNNTNKNDMRDLDLAKSALANLLKDALAQSGKSLEAVAQEAGLSNTDVLRNLVEGTYRLPLDRVRSLAGALDTDPTELLVATMRTYNDNLADFVEEIRDAAFVAGQRSRIDD